MASFSLETPGVGDVAAGLGRGELLLETPWCRRPARPPAPRGSSSSGLAFRAAVAGRIARARRRALAGRPPAGSAGAHPAQIAAGRRRPPPAAGSDPGAGSAGLQGADPRPAPTMAGVALAVRRASGSASASGAVDGSRPQANSPPKHDGHADDAHQVVGAVAVAEDHAVGDDQQTERGHDREVRGRRHVHVLAFGRPRWSRTPPGPPRSSGSRTSRPSSSSVYLRCQ